MDKKCVTCALFIPQNSGCARTRTIELPDNYCSHWANELPICSICGKPFIGSVIWLEVNKEMQMVCGQCIQKFNTCEMCEHGKSCDFKTNPIPIPPVINVTRRQGNMTMTTQGINPARVAETCAKNCKCYYDENGERGCNRQCGTCGNYEDAWKPEVKESEDLSDSTTESA